MRVRSRSNACPGLALCLVAFCVVLAGCSAPPANPTRSSAAQPKHPAPDFSLARLGAEAVLGDVESRNVNGAPTPFRLGSLVPSDSPASVSSPIDPARPLLAQIPPPESVDWPVLDAKGRVVGEITIEWNGTAWSNVGDSSSADSPYQRGLAAKRSKAHLALTKALGGAPEQTRAVRSKYGLWELGRRGSREMGVLVSLPPLETSTKPPLEGSAYGGSDLVKWIEAQ